MFRNRRVFLVLTLIVALLIAVPASAEQSAITTTSRGSGFIVCSSGYILTNYHVVKGATEIEVWMNDGTRYNARLVDYSPTLDEGGYDVALIKIEASGLPALALGDSDSVQLFDEVIAMGYPLTFTLGVQLNVSGGNITSFRKWPEGPQLFQIDAAINPGNSGGPLLNERGEAIAIPTLGITQLEEEIVQGVNFAIPINYAIPVLRSIPGFDTARIGQATERLSPQEIVANSRPAVVFVQAEIERELSTLLPKEVPVGKGYSREFRERYHALSSFPLRVWPWLEDHGIKAKDFAAVESVSTTSSDYDDFYYDPYFIWIAVFRFSNIQDAERASRAFPYPEKPESIRNNFFKVDHWSESSRTIEGIRADLFIRAEEHKGWSSGWLGIVSYHGVIGWQIYDLFFVAELTFNPSFSPVDIAAFSDNLAIIAEVTILTAIR